MSDSDSDRDVETDEEDPDDMEVFAKHFNARQDELITAEARLHALTRSLVELVKTWVTLADRGEDRCREIEGDDWDIVDGAETSMVTRQHANQLQELLARVETPDPSTALVPHPSTVVQSTDQPVKETE